MKIKLKKFSLLAPKVKITTGLKAIAREIYINNDKPINAMVFCQSEGTPILGVLEYRGTYSVDVSNWNSGTIDDEMIFNRVHTVGYWNMPIQTTTAVSAYIVAAGNKPIEYEFVGYDSSGNEVCDLYWYTSGGETMNVPSGVTKFKVVLRYYDDSTILPAQITSCVFSAIAGA